MGTEASKAEEESKAAIVKIEAEKAEAESKQQ